MFLLCYTHYNIQKWNNFLSLYSALYLYRVVDLSEDIDISKKLSNVQKNFPNEKLIFFRVIPSC